MRQELTEDGEQPIDDARRTEILEVARQMAEEALRVLAVAYKRNAATEAADKEMTLLGLVGMIDPPRREAKAAVHECEASGNQGDHDYG